MEKREHLHPNLSDRDRRFVWHPYSQVQTTPSPIIIERGEGVYLESDAGKRYLDGISSWWVNLHGHAHPYITKSIQDQVEKLEQVSFGDFTHAPAVDLAERLCSLLPGEMSKIFYSDNGSTAVEIALKMAIQFHFNRDQKRKKIICFEGAYHGDTFGAMSAAGKNGFNEPFWDFLFDVELITPPFEDFQEKSEEQLLNILEKGDVACFLFEPLVMGVKGMACYPAQGLDLLIKHCKEHGVITIADEVMTGFGRTETLFASETLSHTPDILCLAKGLTGGALPLAATACKEEIFEAFLDSDLKKALLHGHSYTANPIACSAALASLDLIERSTCTEQRAMIASAHAHFRHTIQDHPAIARCQQNGTVLSIEYLSSTTSYFSDLRNHLYSFFLEQGALLRPLGNVVYIIPPYCIQKEELEFLYRLIWKSVELKDVI